MIISNIYEFNVGKIGTIVAVLRITDGDDGRVNKPIIVKDIKTGSDYFRLVKDDKFDTYSLITAKRINKAIHPDGFNITVRDD